MKLRINGNSIRLRLSKPEVEKLAIAGYLEDTTSFGNNVLVYALEANEFGEQLTADFDGAKVTVFIPQKMVDGWFENSVVGFEQNLVVSDKDTLHIKVEKDFKCIDNSDEDQSQNYENPNKSC